MRNDWLDPSMVREKEEKGQALHRVVARVNSIKYGVASENIPENCEGNVSLVMLKGEVKACLLLKSQQTLKMRENMVYLNQEIVVINIYIYI